MTNWFNGLGLGQQVGLIGIALGIITGQWWAVLLAFIVFSFSRAFDLFAAQRKSKSPVGFEKPTPVATAQALLLPAERDVWVRGVGYRQLELAEVGVSTFNALLLPEPENEFDPNAVMVCSGIPDAFIQIGYLPADFEVTELIGELAAKKSGESGHLLAAECVVTTKDDNSFVATIRLPYDETLEEMIAELS